jgi:hypothetical protein
MSFKDAIAAIDVEGAESLSSDAPKFHWYHGVKQARSAGHFFIKAAAAPSTPGAPWEAYTNAYDDQGFKAETLKLAVILKREVWFIPGEQGTRPQYLTGYADGAKLNVELLCFVEGFGDEPLVLSGSGKYKAGSFKNLVRQYETSLLRPAIAVAGKNLHPWTFWIPISTQRDSKGAPVYEMTQGAAGQGAAVTPPIIAGALDMDALFVGAELIKKGEAIKAAYSTWARESRVAGVIEGEVVSHPQLSAPRNVPQAITEGDIPF